MYSDKLLAGGWDSVAMLISSQPTPHQTRACELGRKSFQKTTIVDEDGGGGLRFLRANLEVAAVVRCRYPFPGHSGPVVRNYVDLSGAMQMLPVFVVDRMQREDEGKFQRLSPE